MCSVCSRSPDSEPHGSRTRNGLLEVSEREVDATRVNHAGRLQTFLYELMEVDRNWASFSTSLLQDAL